MSRKLVLVIDDDRDLQDLVEMVLSMHDHGVARAENGQEALALLRGVSAGPRVRPCVVLLDLMLPDMRGEDVFSSMRTMPGQEQSPVVIMSAAAEGHARAQKIGLPFLAKPFGIEELLAAVGRYCPN